MQHILLPRSCAVYLLLYTLAVAASPSRYNITVHTHRERFARVPQRRESCASCSSKPAYIAVGCAAVWVCFGETTTDRVPIRECSTLCKTAGLNASFKPTFRPSPPNHSLPLPCLPPSPRCLVLSLVSNTEIKPGPGSVSLRAGAMFP